MICIRCGVEIPPNSKRIKYCSDRCGRLYLKALYRDRNRGKLRERARVYREKLKEGFVCKVCGERIPLTCKSRQYCSEFCARKSYKRAYYEKHKKDVSKYNSEYRKKKANGKLQKVFEKDICYFCNSNEDLVWHHMEYKPVQKMVRMCASCHRKLHRLLRHRNSGN